MKVIPFLLFFLSFSALAADVPKLQNSKKSKTQIYEQESEETSFEAVVKTVREVQGETEVFFDGKQGFYTLSSENFQHLLVKSQKNKMPVRVLVNTSSRQILKVEIGGMDKN